MRIVCLGGTGTAGILLIRECLSQFPDAHIIIYARSPAKVPGDLAENPSITVIKGSLEDKEALAEAIKGADVILSALGPPTKITSVPFYPSNTPLAHAFATVIELMHTFGVKRLIALGTASITDSEDKFNLEFSVLVNGVATVARNSYKDFVAIGKTVREQGSDLDWTIARVPVLTNKDSKQVIAGYVGDGKTNTSLSRAGFAAWVVNELKSPQWVKKAPLICTGS